MKFEYNVELKDGYKPTMQKEPETEIQFIIDAKNRATADRMVKAMLCKAENVICWSGIAIGD